MRTPTRIKLTALTATLLALAVAGTAQAAGPPVKLIFTRSITNGFEYPESVAAAPNGDVYVADKGNRRVQELTPTGQFVLMFGKEVNASTKGDICTAVSKDTCKAGVKGNAVGQFSEPASLAVDPSSGDVYVAEWIEGAFAERVQEFTADGQFVLEIGREVNEKTKANLCTEKEVEEGTGVKCGAPARATPGADEHGAFNFEHFEGNLLAVGGEQDLLYVGDESRVQEFDAETGVWKGEIPLEPAGEDVHMLALDRETGDVFVVYDGQSSTAIQEFDAKGEKVRTIEIAPRQKEGKIEEVIGLAVDSSGHLAVAASEQTPGAISFFGDLYDASTGHLLTEFPLPDGYVKALAFNVQGELFGAQSQNQEVSVYKPEFVAELSTGGAVCVPGMELETSVRLDCTLEGNVNPEAVAGTEIWFQWGRSELFGEQTPKQPIPTGTAPVSVQAPLDGLRPNETFYYRLVGEDANVTAPELLTGERQALTTPLVAPEVVGLPSASFVKDASVVLFGELNPENASTEYFFEYAPEPVPGEGALARCAGVKHESCPGVATTPGAVSAVYGRIATTMAASGLQPATTYAYRLAASNEHEVAGKLQGGEAKGAEGTFTTAAAPLPSAETGAASAVTATSAVISGAVNPDGLPATYAFELGVYEGSSTHYGIVLSAAAGSAITPTGEAFAVTGLQPGVTYAYRIAVSSGYIQSESHTIAGAPQTFTTSGLASVLALPSVLPQLAIPSIAFPATTVVKPTATKKTLKCAKSEKLTHGKCVKAQAKKKTKAKKAGRSR